MTNKYGKALEVLLKNGTLKDLLQPGDIALVYGSRHGQKAKPVEGQSSNDVLLSPLGEKQVRAAANRNLWRMQADGAAHSGLPRAKQTVRLMLESMGQKDEVEVLTETGIGFVQVDERAKQVGIHQSWGPATTIIADLASKEERVETVEDWIKHGPPQTLMLAGQVLQTILSIGQAFIDYEIPAFVVLGSHSPTIELAAPADFPRLWEADAVVYVLARNDKGNVFIRECHYLPCPVLDQPGI